MMLELSLLPPLVRFFLGFFLILLTTGVAVLILHWLVKGEEEE
ncbi:MAG TPA: hypothetical protein VFJ72_02680 [Rubrobacteraceae bacterium]|nr:hypothetical protein [Rubrobacteraceae bacterium]